MNFMELILLGSGICWIIGGAGLISSVLKRKPKIRPKVVR